MNRFIQYVAIGLLGGGLLVSPVAAQEAHPHFMHAISQLQAADALLQIPDQPNIKADQRRVDKAVRNAIGDCYHAAWWDGRKINYVPPAEMTSDRPGRLHEINSMLHDALADLQVEADTGKSNGWRNKAMSHVTEAMGDLQQVFVDAHIDFGENSSP